jgi:hypothetical protein
MSFDLKKVDVQLPLLQLHTVHSCQGGRNGDAKQVPLTREILTKRMNEAIREIKNLEPNESFFASVDDTPGAQITRLPNDKDQKRRWSIQCGVAAFQITIQLDDQQLADLLIASKRAIDQTPDSDIL